MSQWLATESGLLIRETGLQDIITGIMATRTGGCGNWYCDFPFMDGAKTFRGYRASAACSNLLYALHADNPSFEGGTVGGWLPWHGTMAVISDAWAGIKSLELTATAADPYEYLDITAATANAQYIHMAMVKAGNAGAIGHTWHLDAYGDVSGATMSNTITLSDEWQLLKVIKTYAGDSTRILYSSPNVGMDVGDKILMDAISVYSGSTPFPFEEKECLATSCMFPTPFSAGEPVSMLFFVWIPWVWNDGANHQLFDAQDDWVNGAVWLYKTAANGLYLYTRNVGTGLKYRGFANAPLNIGFNALAFSLDSTNNQKLACNGTLGTDTDGAGTREESIPATIKMGYRWDGTRYFNGIILPFIYRGIAWDDEMCQRMSSLNAPPGLNRRFM